MFTHFSYSGLYPLSQSDPDRLNPLFISESLPPEMMLAAYQHSLFPWYDESDPYILWWSPPTRCIIPTDQVHISRSLRKTMRQKDYVVTFNQDFHQVITLCSTVHGKTWIDQRMKDVCLTLHQQGHMHSIELWEENQLIGGLYGLALPRIFCAESMFSLRPSASKIALVKMCQFLQGRHIPILEAQFMTEHLRTMGAIEISRAEYCQYLQDKKAHS